MSAGASTASSGTQQTSRITNAVIERYAPLGAYGVLLGSLVGQPEPRGMCSGTAT